MSAGKPLHNDLDGPRFDPLTPEREAELLAAWTDEDKRPALRHELVERHLRLVLSIGKGYTHRLPMEECMATGALALTQAADRWDPARGNFYHWAKRWVTTALTKAVDGARTIRVPEEVANGAARAAKDITAREAELGRQLTADERAEVAGGRRTFDTLPTAAASIDDTATDTYSYHETIADDADGPEVLAERSELHERVHEALADLDPLEREVVAARFALDGDRITLTALGRKHGLSAEAVRRVELGALAKLRHPAVRARLDGLL